MGGVNPTRFAMAVAASLACLMLGLLVGVSAGTSRASNVYQVKTVTTTAAPDPVANRTVTLTRTVTAPTTVTVEGTVTAVRTEAAATVHHSSPGQDPPGKPVQKPGHHEPSRPKPPHHPTKKPRPPKPPGHHHKPKHEPKG